MNQTVRRQCSGQRAIFFNIPQNLLRTPIPVLRRPYQGNVERFFSLLRTNIRQIIRSESIDRAHQYRQKWNILNGIVDDAQQRHRYGHLWSGKESPAGIRPSGNPQSLQFLGVFFGIAVCTAQQDTKIVIPCRTLNAVLCDLQAFRQHSMNPLCNITALCAHHLLFVPFGEVEDRQFCIRPRGRWIRCTGN